MDSTELPTVGDEQLGALRRAAQDVFDQRHARDLDATLTQLVSAAVAAVPGATESGFRSMLSTHLGARAGGPRGALSLYAREPDAFPAHSWITAGLFSLQAATVLHGADEAHLLTRALHSRDVVGRAKGILSERFGTGDAEAFRMLVDAAQDTRLELAEVAAWLCAEAQDRHRARRDTTPRRLTAER